MKSDIEIARETDLRKIKEVATTLGIPREEVRRKESVGFIVVKSGAMFVGAPDSPSYS